MLTKCIIPCFGHTVPAVVIAGGSGCCFAAAQSRGELNPVQLHLLHFTRYIRDLQTTTHTQTQMQICQDLDRYKSNSAPQDTHTDLHFQSDSCCGAGLVLQCCDTLPLFYGLLRHRALGSFLSTPSTRLENLTHTHLYSNRMQDIRSCLASHKYVNMNSWP